MSQQVFAQDPGQGVSKEFLNVPEVWQLWDTILIGLKVNTLTPRDGYFNSYALFGAQSEFSFFNVRNRAHGLPYNNQDSRDQLPYVFHIYSMGVAWFSASTSTYGGANPPLGEDTVSNKFWMTEIPKHVSVILRTNQDERLATTALMVPPGYGPVGGGVASGDMQAARTNPNMHHTAFNVGESMLINTWGFPKPLQIPRTANLSVVLRINTYCQSMLQQFPGPRVQPLKAVANDGTNYGAYATSGIQVFLKGKREVQQRGQYHA